MTQCTNCGATYDDSSKTCPNCGAANPAFRMPPVLRIVFVTLFFLVGLPVGCFGSCTLLLMTSSPTQDPGSLVFGAGMVAFVGLFGLLFWLAFIKK